MPIIIPPGWGLVAHQMSLLGSAMPSGPSVVTYGIHFAGTDPQDAVETAAAYFGSLVASICSSSYQLDLTTLKVGPNSTGATYESTNTAQGANGTTAVSPQVAVLVKKLTGIGGRSQRGRFYMPGADAGDLTQTGAFNSGAVSDWQTDANTFLAGLATEGIPMVLLHSASSDPTEVTELVVQGQSATQRRRNR